jgi:hypothetical protein
MKIGKKGETDRNLSNKYGIQVKLPKKGKVNNENIIKIIGYRQKAESARDKIQEMVDKFVSLLTF